MKRPVTIIIILGLIIAAGLYAKKKFNGPKKVVTTDKQVDQLTGQNGIRDGDIIFQTSISEQSKAIQLATHSKYSHCGIVYKTGNEYFVFEAIEPVKLTPLAKWIGRGQNRKYVIKRLKNADQVLTIATVKKMKQVGEGFKSKHYDIYFEWSDDKIYCSELIWKVYKQAAGIEVGKLEKLQDFDLTAEPVKQKMKQRYGNNIPLDELVISPASIYNSPLLITVKAN